MNDHQKNVSIEILQTMKFDLQSPYTYHMIILVS